jgi:hypothetical protein
MGRRGPVRLAGQREEPRLGLHEVVVARPVPPRPGAAVGREVGAHDPRVVRLEVLVGQPERVGLVTAEVPHQAVGRPDQPVEDLPPSGMFQVERERALVPVEGLEEETVPLAQGVRADAP